MGLASTTWLKVSVDLTTHPKTLQAADRLGVSEYLIAGHLIALWSWGQGHAAPDGRLPDLPREVLGRRAGWTRKPADFIDTLESVGFVDCRDGALYLHDWDDYTADYYQGLQTSEAIRKVRKEASVRGVHERWHVRGGRTDPTCELCQTSEFGMPDGIPLGMPFGNAGGNALEREEEGEGDRASDPEPDLLPDTSSSISIESPVKRSRPTALTAEFLDEMRLKFIGFDIDREAEDCRDYHASKGNKIVDWKAAFRRWMRNAVDYRARNGGRNDHNGHRSNGARPAVAGFTHFDGGA